MRKLTFLISCMLGTRDPQVEQPDINLGISEHLLVGLEVEHSASNFPF